MLTDAIPAVQNSTILTQEPVPVKCNVVVKVLFVRFVVSANPFLFFLTFYFNIYPYLFHKVWLQTLSHLTYVLCRNHFLMYCNHFVMYYNHFEMYCNNFVMNCNHFLMYCNHFVLDYNNFLMYCIHFVVHCNHFVVYCNHFVMYRNHFLYIVIILYLMAIIS